MQLIADIRARRPAREEAGFTMIVAIIVLFVTSLLVAGALVAANGDIHATSTDTSRKKAYYAALAGINAYQYQLSANPNYWIKCPESANVKVPSSSDEQYTTSTLPSSNHTKCESDKQPSILELNGTFRIKSVGTSGGAKRTIVASFTHPGFLNYVYFTNYEVEDPTNFEPEKTTCEHYYSYWHEKGQSSPCGEIEFIEGDKVNGPMHTNDSADICSGSEGPVFGRTSKDAIEMNGGHHSSGYCGNSPKIVGKYTESAPTLLPPETDAELLESAQYKFKGKTIIVLKTNPSMMKVTTFVSGAEKTEEKPFPSNGVVYIENGAEACAVKYTPFNSDYVHDTNCGNVYISGSYSESLTVAAAGDVIINGNLTTTTTGSGEPTGGAVLGLIATNFVRIYHPVKNKYTTRNVVPATQEPVNGHCGAAKEVSARISASSNTVTEINTSGLEPGDEVAGSRSGQIKAGTTITGITSWRNEITLSSRPEKSERTTLLIYVSNGYEYNASLGLCHKIESGYSEYRESENRYITACEYGTKYEGEGYCGYEITSSGSCPSKATNLSAAEDPNKLGGSQENIVIDAAILSTKHSFVVDNYKCGAHLGELTVWGSIAQFWRGPVGTSGGSGTGYTKNYNYDDRLEVEQPPNFLSPTSTSWHLSRETQPCKEVQATERSGCSEPST
jgi:Tfp pilus assembly protein PilX